MAEEETPQAEPTPTPEPAPALYKEDAPSQDPPSPEPAPEPAPEPEDPHKRGFEDLARREKELRAKEQSIGSLSKAQQALESGDHRAAAEALGIDTFKLLADTFGEDMLPEKEEPSTDDVIGGVKEELEKYKRELADTRSQMARFQLYNKLSKHVTGESELEIVPELVKEAGDTFYDELIDYAIATEKDTGQRPDWNTVIGHAEKTYADRYCNVGKRVLQLKSVRERLLADPEVREALGLTKSTQAPKPPAPKPAPPTLANADSTAQPPREDRQPATQAERRAEALRALREGIVPNQ